MKKSLISLAVLAATSIAATPVSANLVFMPPQLPRPSPVARSWLDVDRVAQRIHAAHWLVLRPPMGLDRWPMVPRRL